MIPFLAALAIDLAVVDKATGKPVPCRVHLADPAGKPVQAPGLPFWRDHFVCPGTVRLDLPPGRYAYEVERGPEWSRAKGDFDAGAGSVRLEIERIADLPSRGWWPGDLHIHRAPEEVDLHAAAEDLFVLPVITWWNRRNLWADRERPADPLRRLEGGRWARVMEGEDEREGGALLYFNLPAPLAIQKATRETPSPMKFLLEARAQAGAHVDVEKPFWWDVPVWLASGKVDSIGLANNHMCRSRMYENEAWGRPRDEKRLPPPRGNGWWTQEIYYQSLEAGLRVPPSAGSASGVLPNPVGYNRVYVLLEGGLDWTRWWEGLRAGRSFVTNGPLLLATAGGRPPGHVFDAEGEVEVRAELLGRESVKALELVRNGRVEATFTPGGALRIPLRESGWFLVRAVTEHAPTFRFASTAPWHVELGGRRRISRSAARFFLDWVDERAKRVKVDDPEERRLVLEPHETARRFWQERLDRATAD
jgi:hypothetical protein